MKFGGASIGTSVAMMQMLGIIMNEGEHWDNLIIVASALEGVTDMLLEAAHLAQLSNQRGYRRIAATIRTRHHAFADQLPLDVDGRTALKADLDRLLFDMIDTCQTVANTTSDNLAPRLSDIIVAVGERLSTTIIAALLRHNGKSSVMVDGKDIIVTNDVHGNASILVDRSQQKINDYLIPLLDSSHIPIITGFIGATTDGQLTTLGRGGSDYTASMISASVGSDEIWMWTDIDGMMSADPRQISDAQIISELSYREVTELAYFGARIIHTQMIPLLMQDKIPVRIKNVYKPKEAGTFIRESTNDEAQIKAVTSIQGLALTSEQSGSLSNVMEIVDETLFDILGHRADVMITSQSSSRSFICLVVPPNVGMNAGSRQRLQEAIGKQFDDQPLNIGWDVYPVSVITAIGDDIDQHPNLIASILQNLTTIAILAIAQGPSHCSFSIVVHENEMEQSLKQIHRLIVNT